MKARVYRNLNKGGLSIQTKVEGKGKVTDYSNYAVLENCTFRVSQTARNKILAGANRSVHAWIEGDLLSLQVESFTAAEIPTPYYSPYKTEFFEIDGQPVTHAKAVKVYAPSKATKEG